MSTPANKPPIGWLNPQSSSSRNKSDVLTVFSDASFRLGFAGIAVWGRGDGEERIMHSEPLTWTVENSGEAETVALATAIIMACEQLPHGPAPIIVAQSDCLSSLGLFVGKHNIFTAKTSDMKIPSRVGKGNLVESQWVIQTTRIMAEHGAKVYLKHVRGHGKGVEKRSAVNVWCDEHANNARRRAEGLRRVRSAHEVESAMLQSIAVVEESHGS